MSVLQWVWERVNENQIQKVRKKQGERNFLWLISGEIIV